MKKATPTGKTLIHLASSLAVAAVLSGCTPYVYATKEFDTYRAAIKPKANPSAYALALDFALAQQQAYRKEKDNQARLARGTTLSLLPIAGILGFNVLKGVTSDLNTGLVVGGAAVYAGSQYLYSTPRQRIYLAGEEAISCVVKAFENVSAAERETTALAGWVTAVGQHINNLQMEIERVASLNTAQDPQATAVLASSRETIAQAKAVLAKGRTTYAILSAAHTKLNAATSKAITSVDRALIEEELPPRFMTDIVKSAQALHGEMFVARTQTGGNGPGGGAAFHPETLSDEQPTANALAGHVNALANAEAALATLAAQAEIERVAAVLATPPADQLLKECTTAIGEAGNTIVTIPSAKMALDNAQAKATARIAFSGGKAPYNANWTGEPLPPSDKVTFTGPTLGASGTLGEIVVSAETGVAGSYTLTLSDSQGDARSVVIELNGTPEPAAETGNEPAPGTGTAPGAAEPGGGSGFGPASSRMATQMYGRMTPRQFYGPPTPSTIAAAQFELARILGGKVVVTRGETTGEETILPDGKDGPVTRAAIQRFCLRARSIAFYCQIEVEGDWQRLYLVARQIPPFSPGDPVRTVPLKPQPPAAAPTPIVPTTPEPGGGAAVPAKPR